MSVGFPINHPSYSQQVNNLAVLPFVADIDNPDTITHHLDVIVSRLMTEIFPHVHLMVATPWERQIMQNRPSTGIPCPTTDDPIIVMLPRLCLMGLLDQVAGIHGPEVVECPTPFFLSDASFLSSILPVISSLVTFLSPLSLSMSAFFLLHFHRFAFLSLFVSAHLSPPHLTHGASFRYALSHPRRSIIKSYEPHLPLHSISDILYHISTTIPPVIIGLFIVPLSIVVAHFYMYVL